MVSRETLEEPEKGLGQSGSFWLVQRVEKTTLGHCWLTDVSWLGFF